MAVSSRKRKRRLTPQEKLTIFQFLADQRQSVVLLCMQMGEAQSRETPGTKRWDEYGNNVRYWRNVRSGIEWLQGMTRE